MNFPPLPSCCNLPSLLKFCSVGAVTTTLRSRGDGVEPSARCGGREIRQYLLPPAYITSKPFPSYKNWLESNHCKRTQILYWINHYSLGKIYAKDKYKELPSFWLSIITTTRPKCSPCHDVLMPQNGCHRVPTSHSEIWCRTASFISHVQTALFHNPTPIFSSK